MNSFVNHTISPVYDKNSRILILGTMPSPRSRELGFYYSHPQNRFWRIISDIMEQSVPQTNLEKTSFLLDNNIALWDVLKSCSISGADDSTIKAPVPNDLSEILHGTAIKAIFTTGSKAAALYRRYCLDRTKIEAINLPSTSPANCRFYTYERLLDEYRVLKEYI